MNGKNWPINSTTSGIVRRRRRGRSDENCTPKGDFEILTKRSLIAVITETLGFSARPIRTTEGKLDNVPRWRESV
uniref:Uncharacterized protein n=1 Tax=Steinernema glaseri TaxID=37863 RepID=A0A1I7ZB32_9BILA